MSDRSAAEALSAQSAVEPRTEAGRAHHDGLHFHDGLYVCAPDYERCGIRQRILAIEAEARATSNMTERTLAELCEREDCNSGCHSDSCEHHGYPKERRGV